MNSVFLALRKRPIFAASVCILDKSFWARSVSSERSVTSSAKSMPSTFIAGCYWLFRGFISKPSCSTCPSIACLIAYPTINAKRKGAKLFPCNIPAWIRNKSASPSRDKTLAKVLS